jgi:hypothetical protein
MSERICLREDVAEQIRKLADLRESGAVTVEEFEAEKKALLDFEVQARLEARLRATDLGAVLAARGVTTVALSEQGELTEYRPDGKSAPV